METGSFRVVVVGAGDVGMNITQRLADTHEVTIIDTDTNYLEKLDSEWDIDTVEGDGRSLSALTAAGIKTADVVIASTDDDAVNIMVCGAAANLTDAFTIARVKSPDLFETWQSLDRGLGIDLMLNTASLTATRITRTVELPGALNVEVFAEGKAEMGRFNIDAEDPIANQPIKEIDQFPSLTFAGILRNSDVIIPNGETVVKPEDQITVIGTPSSVRRFATRLPEVKALSDDDEIVIIGGGEVGYRTARLFEKRGHTLRLIEHGSERAEELTKRLSRTEIVEGEATFHKLLTDEQIAEADLVVSTVDDETNYLISLLVTQLGVDYTAAVVDRIEYRDLFEAAGVDVTIQPHTVIAEEIGHATRKQTNNATLLQSSNAQVLELTIDQESIFAGQSIEDVVQDLPNGIVIGAVVRGGTVTTPRGGTIIQVGDEVVVFVDTSNSNEIASVL